MQRFYWRSAAEGAFADQQGWRVSRFAAGLGEIAASSRGLKHEEYPPEQLGHMFDHATFYDWRGSRRPAALIVHPYGHFTPEQVQAVARLYGVLARIVQPGWYHPNAQTIIFSSLCPVRPAPRRARTQSKLPRRATQRPTTLAKGAQT